MRLTKRGWPVFARIRGIDDEIFTLHSAKPAPKSRKSSAKPRKRLEPRGSARTQACENAWKLAAKQPLIRARPGEFSASKNARFEAQPQRNCMILKNSQRKRGVSTKLTLNP